MNTIGAQILVLLAAAVIAVPLFRRYGLSSVLGYLAAGVVVGPWALGLIRSPGEILHLSEIGVVFLLFVIGLELQPSRLWALRRPIFGTGTAQVVLTTFVLTLFAILLGLPPITALIAGFGLSMSSTAFVLQMLAERKELGTSQGRASFAILLFQDIAVIPVLVALRVIYQPSGQGGLSALAIAIPVVVIVGMFLVGRYLLRPFFRIVATFGIPETFSAAALLVVLGAAIGLESVGLSMSLGAFLAGVLLADSEYRHELEASIEPFKGLLLGLFFVAVGMTTNLGLIVHHPLEVLGLTLGLLVIKGMILFVIGKAFKLSTKASRALAFALPQGGEFAFVLFSLAVSLGLLPQGDADLLILVVAFSMALTPLVTLINKRLIDPWTDKSNPPVFDRIDESGNPVIIAGFGRFGQIVARVLRTRGIPFTALEISSEQVNFVRRFGSKIYYGDASKPELLRAAGAADARIFVLAIDDVEASVRTAEVVRHNFPNMTIYARARNRYHSHLLMEMGITHTVRETLLSSFELTAQILGGLGISEKESRHIMAVFSRHDKELLERQFAVFRDQDRLIQTSREAVEELETLFEGDTWASDGYEARALTESD